MSKEQPFARYDRIGLGYSRHRREDLGFAQRIDAALNDADTVLNVGAGAGSYEPAHRRVVAVEPSQVMIDQRPCAAGPALRALASALPFGDNSVDAAMAVVTLHHWDQGQQAGVKELRRVARGPVVIVTYDAQVSALMWLVRDYLPEAADLDRRTFPPPLQVARWLGPGTSVEALPIPADTPDRMLGAFWVHPEWVLDESTRNATSAFARQPPEVVERVVRDVGRDLASGRWDERYGHLRLLDEFDAGLRLLVQSGSAA